MRALSVGKVIVWANVFLVRALSVGPASEIIHSDDEIIHYNNECNTCFNTHCRASTRSTKPHHACRLAADMIGTASCSSSRHTRASSLACSVCTTLENKVPSVAARTHRAATARATAPRAAWLGGHAPAAPVRPSARPLRGAESHVEPPGRQHPNNAFTYNKRPINAIWL